MDENKIIEALKKAKENSKERKFKQSYDLIVNLKDLDLKKPDQQVDVFTTLHFGRGKEIKICGLIGPELKEEANSVCDKTITVEEFDQYAKDKKLAKKLAEEYDFFIAQANIMGKVAQSFGRVFGPKGKMPNPKSGCVVPPKTQLKPLYAQLQKTIRISVKTQQSFRCFVGKEDMAEKELIDNILTIYKALVHALPKEENNIKNVIIKTTMGSPVVVGN